MLGQVEERHIQLVQVVVDPAGQQGHKLEEERTDSAVRLHIEEYPSKERLQMRLGLEKHLCNYQQDIYI
jgi:hypothetical protein